jgi:hypothetical protein
LRRRRHHATAYPTPGSTIVEGDATSLSPKSHHRMHVAVHPSSRFSRALRT